MIIGIREKTNIKNILLASPVVLRKAIKRESPRKRHIKKIYLNLSVFGIFKPVFICLIILSTLK